MRVLAKLYPKDDSADRATAMIADVVFLTVLLAGGLYWWHSAQPEHGQDALPQVVTSQRDRGEGHQPGTRLVRPDGRALCVLARVENS